MSICHLRGLLDKATDRYSIALALVTCIIHTYLDYLRGQHIMAGMHLENGLKLLSELHTTKSPNYDGVRVLKFVPGLMDRRIIEIFARLHVQADLFGQPMGRISILLQPMDDEVPGPIFESVEEARDSLNKLLHGLLLLKDKLQGSSGREVIIPQSRIETILSGWYRTYRTTLQLPKALSGRDAIAYRLLYMYYQMTRIMTVALYVGNESAYDSCAAGFVAILQESIDTRELVNAENLPFREIDMCDSIGDIGWIPPLFFTAIKCRDPRLRRQAIKLLKSRSHKEGIWDTNVVTLVATKVLELEENHFFDEIDVGDERPSDATPEGLGQEWPCLPEIRRILDIRILLPDGISGRIELICNRKVLGGHTQVFKYCFNETVWTGPYEI